MRPSEALERHRSSIAEVMSRYAVDEPRIFGSTARGEDTEASDLDILVRRKGPLSYFDLARLEMELESLLGVRVDIRTEGEFRAVTMAALKKDLRAL